MNNKNYNEITDFVKSLAKFIKADANTFLWAKSQSNFTEAINRNENGIYDLGGGNFYITLACLSFYSFIAKIYEIFSYNNCDRLFKTNKKLMLKSDFKNETESVKNLTEAINSHCYFIDKIENIYKFWELMRHGLVHCYYPKNQNSTLFAAHSIELNSNSNFLNYCYSLDNNNDFAVKAKIGGGFNVNSDLLAVKVVKISEWLISYIQEQKYDKSKSKCIFRLLEI